MNTPAFTNSLQLWVNMVKDGSASKSVLQWGQDPDLTQQFLHKTAAMIEDGPWIFPELNSAGWKYNKQYGIVQIPTQTAGRTVVTPLGGETWNIGNSGSAQQQNAAWEWIKGMQAPSVMTHVTSLMYYLPTKPAVIAQYLKGGPEYTVFAKETATARSRTTQYGANYPKVSQAIWTAIQAAITGTASVSSALNPGAVHDFLGPAGQGGGRLSKSESAGDGQRPRIRARPLRGPGQRGPGQNEKPPGRPLRSAISPARVAMAISGGVREPMFSPTGRCTRAMSSSGTPRSASAWMCGA